MKLTLPVAYTKGQIYILTRNKKKKGISALPSLVYMPHEIVTLAKIKDCPCPDKSVSILLLWEACYFYFYKQKFLSTRGFSCRSATQKLLKLLWLLGFCGQSDYHWMEMIQNTFCGAVFVVGTNSVTKTSRTAAGQTGMKVRKCAKLINQRKRFQE